MRLTRNLITGGAGFLGSHLTDRLMEAGEEVICLDNYFTGRCAISPNGLVTRDLNHSARCHRSNPP